MLNPVARKESVRLFRRLLNLYEAVRSAPDIHSDDGIQATEFNASTGSFQIGRDGNNFSVYHQFWTCGSNGNSPNVVISAKDRFARLFFEETEIPRVVNARAYLQSGDEQVRQTDIAYVSEGYVLICNNGQIKLLQYQKSTKEPVLIGQLSAGWIIADITYLDEFLRSLSRELEIRNQHLKDASKIDLRAGKSRPLDIFRGYILKNKDHSNVTSWRKFFTNLISVECVQKSQDGKFEFESDMEFGTSARYWLDEAAQWRPAVSESIVIMHYGQSNASIVTADGVIDNGLRRPVHVSGLQDGYGARGLMGMPSGHDARLGPVDQHIMWACQSMPAVAGGRYLELRQAAGMNPMQVIARSEAKGAQPIIGKHDFAQGMMPGLHKDDTGRISVCFYNLIASLEAIIHLAAEDGAPVSRIYIPFTHQESDRYLPASEYAAKTLAMFTDVEARLCAHDIPVFWLLDQAAGTGARNTGNAWASREALWILAGSAPNIHYLQPRYPYPLSDDVHWSAKARVLYGEFLAHAIFALESGEAFQPPKLSGHSVDGGAIYLRFDTLTPLVLEENPSFPALDSVKGFSLENADGLEITDVSIHAKDTVRVKLNKCIEAKVQASLCYAYRSCKRGKYAATGWPYGTGLLRESWQRKCITFEDETLYRWVPGFRLEL